jgi:hypothetical protein
MVESVVDLILSRFELSDFRFDCGCVDRTDDDLPEVLATGDCLSGLVGLEQEREQFCEFRLIEILIAARDDRSVFTRERSTVGLSVDSQLYFATIGITLDRDVSTPTGGFDCLEKR